MAIKIEVQDGVGELVIDAPPVNALDNAGWREFAEKMVALGQRDDVHCVVIRSEGRGFQAGVDVKELAENGDLIVELNRGCYDSFAAIYDCPVPTIAAVHGFCIGGGIGIAGSSDFVIASEDATFSLPEIDRGALGLTGANLSGANLKRADLTAAELTRANLSRVCYDETTLWPDPWLKKWPKKPESTCSDEQSGE